jgi:hypothetical protein
MLSFIAHGQETKQVKTESKNGDLEIYSVLKADKNIKHGPYEKYIKYSTPMTKGTILIEKGQYDSGKKTGIWTFYWGENNITSKGPFENDKRAGNWEYYKNNTVIEKGNFKDDLREGLWVYFEKDKGILERGSYKDGIKVGKWNYRYLDIPVQTYDHSLDSVLQCFYDNTETETITDSSRTFVNVVLQRPAQYVGHKRQLHNDMSALTKYPLEARRMMLEGQVILSMTIKDDGTTADYAIMKDIGGNCGQAVIDAYKANTKKWIPALYNGRRVSVKYYQSIQFKLLIDPITGLGQTEILYE